MAQEEKGEERRGKVESWGAGGGGFLIGSKHSSHPPSLQPPWKEWRGKGVVHCVPASN